MSKTLLVRGTAGLPEFGQPVVATLGSFDGFHQGHIALLEKVNQIKSGWLKEGLKPTSLVISFHPHPSLVLKKRTELKLISSLRQKLQILSQYNVDFLYMVHFTKEFSLCSAEDFVRDVLVNKLGINTFVIGEDATLGYNRRGNIEVLQKNLEIYGRKLVAVSKVFGEGERISSERIREAIKGGDLKAVRALLGRNYILDSYVVSGVQVGRRIGFPTANIKQNEQIIPADGVYVTKIFFNGKAYQSITNVGNCPTFSNRSHSVETHILTDENLDLYTHRVEVEFLEKIRDEIKFSNIQDLQEQIKADIAFTNAYFKQNQI